MKAHASHTEGSRGSASLPAQLATRIIKAVRAVVLYGARHRVPQAKLKLLLIETLSLGPKKSLHLIECAGEQIVVGTGADGVTALLRIGQAAVKQTSTELM